MARTAPRPAATIQQYLDTSRRPLQILAFLLPLILLYEIGLRYLLRSEAGVLTNKAHETLLRFFAAFGTTGVYVGAIAVAVVLLVWHVLARDPWRIDVRALGIMAAESLLLSLPLIALGQLVLRVLAFSPAHGTMLEDLDLWSRISISIGAGLYEELMFRMMLVAIIHTLLVDVGKASSRLGAMVGVVVAAAAFTAYHPLSGPDGSFSMQKAVFFFLAGLYFGAIYVIRGFGIVVAVHALYDILTVSLLSAATAVSD